MKTLIFKVSDDFFRDLAELVKSDVQSPIILGDGELRGAHVDGHELKAEAVFRIWGSEKDRDK